MMTTEGSTKIVNFMTPGAGALKKWSQAKICLWVKKLISLPGQCKFSYSQVTVKDRGPLLKREM